ncbi:hypothetical protein D5274_19070 [bacterium 1XD42-94]|nr:hypothetical protein [bacterium 1XD42-76]NBK07149.1 hypothetical protein [bacterium 1XD42-94]
MKDSNILHSEVRKTFETLIESGVFTEVRLLNTKQGTLSGYYNDVDKLIEHIQRYDGNYNIYITMNALSEGIEARGKNHLKSYAKNTTSDKEIRCRRWILIDLDPERPAGISSTEQELKLSEELGRKIQGYLTDCGFPEPVTALSGNGFHLLYPVELPNTPEMTSLAKGFLGALDSRFSTEQVKVDTTTYNAARITKLYGTVSCKGDSTEERPHRRSKILYAPKKRVPVAIELLQQIAAQCVEKGNKKKTVNRNEKREPVRSISGSKMEFDLCLWLESHEIPVAREKQVENGMCYVLESCPWNQEHSKDNGAYVIQFDDGGIAAGCHHDSCKEENWETLWRMLEGEKPMPSVKKAKTENLPSAEKESPVDVLLRLIEEQGHIPFRSTEGEAFIQIPNNGGFVNYPIKSEYYQMWLRNQYYQTYNRGSRGDMIQAVMETLIAKAHCQGKEYPVYNRFAFHEGRLYYNLADRDSTVLCVDKSGIKCCSEPPVRLITRKNIRPQPMPQKGKSFRKLMNKYYHFASMSDRILHNVILIVRLITGIEQPIVIYKGSRGSSKTTSMEMDKRCLDVSSNNVTVMPKNEEDFLLLLESQDIVCLDNMDSITKSQANIFCQAVTGATAVKRKKYSDSELCEINIRSVVYMNGIHLISDRSDFLDRCVFLNMKAISSEKRRSKKEVMEEFEEDKPYILYGMFECLSKAMETQPSIEIELDDRLLDFLKWGCAVAEALGYGQEEFLKAYQKNRISLNEELLEEDEVAGAVMDYLEESGNFEGAMSELSAELSDMLYEKGMYASNKIKQANHLSRRLKELEAGLHNVGICVEIGKNNGKRFVKISRENTE